MVKASELLDCIGADFYTGVPDSQLKELCDELQVRFGNGKQHIIAANEGNAVGLAAGYHLATGKVPVVYLQNSGIGNVVNPVASLMHQKVYGIPCIFIVGWRGEPGTKDEPQHVFQGEITIPLLDQLEIETFVITQETTMDELVEQMKHYRGLLQQGKNVSFVIKKGALQSDTIVRYENNYQMNREEIIEHIVAVSKDDTIVSTTGKASRELFEIREANNQGHQHDFLTVGSMGHSSSIALGIALEKPDRKIWCIDGDGAALMHMGAMAVIGNRQPNNMVHIVINNEAHETVGGMPTVSCTMDLVQIALGCGYENACMVSKFDELDKVLMEVKQIKGLSFIEVKSSIGSRLNLGRPTISAVENKEGFMVKTESSI
ncbi:MAG: phosphonopyruvate decarboxylase [Eubacteriales bacterium]